MSLQDVAILAGIFLPIIGGIFGYFLGKLNKCTKEIEDMKTDKQLVKQSMESNTALIKKNSEAIANNQKECLERYQSLNEEIESNQKENNEKFSNLKDIISAQTIKIQETINTNYIQLLEKIGKVS